MIIIIGNWIEPFRKRMSLWSEVHNLVLKKAHDLQILANYLKLGLKFIYDWKVMNKIESTE